MQKKNNTVLYVGISIALIIAAIAVTAIFNNAKQGTSEDIRAKAGVTSTLRVAGTVSSVDEARGVFVLSNFRFTTSESPANMGSWTVTPPPGFALSSLSGGTKITMTIDPATMLAVSSTVTAIQITVER